MPYDALGPSSAGSTYLWSELVGFTTTFIGVYDDYIFFFLERPIGCVACVCVSFTRDNEFYCLIYSVLRKNCSFLPKSF